GMSPSRIRKKVVLPQPLGPTSEMNSDGWTAKEMPSKTWIDSSDLWLRKLLRRFCTTSFDARVSTTCLSRLFVPVEPPKSSSALTPQRKRSAEIRLGKATFRPNAVV